jgi:thiamine pyrophosphate-dependent acetolactate synthase large subunit-like protein
MTYNFDNIAIRCDTWQQMERLAEIAEKQGIQTCTYLFNEQTFNDGHKYFLVNLGYYANCGYVGVEKVTFTTFITSHPDYRVEGC